MLVTVKIHTAMGMYRATRNAELNATVAAIAELEASGFRSPNGLYNLAELVEYGTAAGWRIEVVYKPHTGAAC